MDTKDKVLLKELQDDSNRPKTELAKIVGLAGNTLSDRIKRLKDEGFIRRIGAVLNPPKVGLPTTAFVFGTFKDGLKTSTDDLRKLVAEKRQVNGAQIAEVHTLYGNVDVIFKVRAVDTAALAPLINVLEKDAKLKTQTLIVAESVLENAGVIIDIGA